MKVAEQPLHVVSNHASLALLGASAVCARARKILLGSTGKGKSEVCARTVSVGLLVAARDPLTLNDALRPVRIGL